MYFSPYYKDDIYVGVKCTIPFFFVAFVTVAYVAVLAGLYCMKETEKEPVRCDSDPIPQILSAQCYVFSPV